MDFDQVVSNTPEVCVPFPTKWSSLVEIGTNGHITVLDSGKEEGQGVKMAFVLLHLSVFYSNVNPTVTMARGKYTLYYHRLLFYDCFSTFC